MIYFDACKKFYEFTKRLKPICSQGFVTKIIIKVPYRLNIEQTTLIMNKSLYTILFFLVCISGSFSQNVVGIGNALPDSNAIMDLQSTNKGILIPRMSSLQRNNMSPSLGLNQKGLMVFDNDSTKFLYWNGIIWQTFGSGAMGPAGPAGTTILYSNLRDTASSATNIPQFLRSWTMPANTLTNDGSYIEIEVFGTISNQTNYPTLQIMVGGLNMAPFYPSINTAYSGNFYMTTKMYRVNGNYVKFFSNAHCIANIPNIDVTYGSLNLSTNLSILFMAHNVVAGSNNIVISGFTVRKVE